MRTFVAAVAILIVPAMLQSQITRNNYYNYVPAMGKLVTETPASRVFHLYGDASGSSYIDVDENGIDDRRQAQLQRIAYQFSPLLRRNNFSFPRNFKDVLGDDDIVHIDTWAAG